MPLASIPGQFVDTRPAMELLFAAGESVGEDLRGTLLHYMVMTMCCQ